MFFLIRAPSKHQFVRRQGFGFSDFLFQIIKTLGVYILSEYGALAAGLALIFLGGALHAIWVGGDHVWATLWNTLWNLGKATGMLILAFISFIRMWTHSSKKSGPKKSKT